MRVHGVDMPTAEGSVVPEMSVVTEAEFRAAMLAGLSRCSNTPARKRALGGVMDLTTKGLDNILLKGAMPGAKRLWDALLACPSALDEIAARYGVEIVPAVRGGVLDLGTVPLSALLAHVAAAEAPASESGPQKNHNELLGMEDLIRTVHALTGQWMKEIDEHRAPTTSRRN